MFSKMKAYIRIIRCLFPFGVRNKKQLRYLIWALQEIEETIRLQYNSKRALHRYVFQKVMLLAEHPEMLPQADIKYPIEVIKLMYHAPLLTYIKVNRGGDILLVMSEERLEGGVR